MRTLTIMDEADSALIRAWHLALEDYTDEIYAVFEQLLPSLVEAGYAEADEHTWHFTPRGVARAEELIPDDPPD